VTSLCLATDSLVRRDSLAKAVGDLPILYAGIDGPLRPGLDQIGEYRNAEALLTRRFRNTGIGKPGQSNSGNGILLNRHANEIARGLIELGLLGAATHDERIDEAGIVEAFPTTFLGVMLDRGKVPSSKAKSDVFFEHLAGPDSPKRLEPATNRLVGLLSRLLPGREIDVDGISKVTDHEERAAVVCALAALCVACGQYVAVGDRKNGYILLLPRAEAGEPGLQPWAWEILRRNLHDAEEEFSRCVPLEPGRRPELIARAIAATPASAAS
jgi:hypothetical protein